MEGIVYAPFTTEQVDSINGYQEASVGHPYTCSHCRDEEAQQLRQKHPNNLERWALRSQHLLVARQEGLVCPECGRVQISAHSFLADGSWKVLQRKVAK